MAVTAKQIAEKLGISQATVSVALNNKPGVSTELKREIIRTAEELGYEFRRDREGERFTRTVYVIIYRMTARELAGTSYTEINEGIRAALMREGFKINIQQYNERSDDIGALMEQLRSDGCAGILLIGTEMSRMAVQFFLSLKIPTVLVDAYYDSLDCSCVLANNDQGAYLATNYLINQYGTTPGILRSSRAISKYIQRNEGYLKALNKNAIRFPSSDVIFLSPSIEMAMAEMLEHIESGRPLARCYLAESDRIAIGAMKALQIRGYRVPDDVAIIGFGNTRDSRIVDPQLTTVDVPRETIGSIAASLLIEEIRGRNREKVKIQVATKLIRRFTTSEAPQKA